MLGMSDGKLIFCVVLGENTVNGDQSDAHMSTLSQSSKEVRLSLHNLKRFPKFIVILLGSLNVGRISEKGQEEEERA